MQIIAVYVLICCQSFCYSIWRPWCWTITPISVLSCVASVIRWSWFSNVLGSTNPGSSTSGRNDPRSKRPPKSVQSNVAKGCIVVLSPLSEANEFVRCVRWAGTFASGGRQTVRNAPIVGTLKWATHAPPQKCPFPWGIVIPI